MPCSEILATLLLGLLTSLLVLATLLVPPLSLLPVSCNTGWLLVLLLTTETLPPVLHTLDTLANFPRADHTLWTTLLHCVTLHCYTVSHCTVALCHTALLHCVTLHYCTVSHCTVALCYAALLHCCTVSNCTVALYKAALGCTAL